ncbi:MAG TPA: glycoside hydrolase family 13 protein [Bacteroidota bacterium]|jgi:glycosidase|nr:glycoside hydrolase family 13 protein [Bacteroidota bacterium]
MVITLLASLSVSGQEKPDRYSRVPSWAKEAVWYQIFPERFRNGDSSNDPRVEDLAGSWPHEPPGEWHISPWSSDWYLPQPWETSDEKGFYHFVQRRRYGGDLQGVIDKLDYLADLGVNALYFNPLFESPSLHKYDATMYHHIDNNFGPDPQGDRAAWAQEDPAGPSTWKWTSADKLFLKLVEEAHRRSMKIIIDGVFNHVGMTFWAFEDVKKNQQNSKFKDWFTIPTWDDPATPENEFDYAGWFGVKELPELREDGDGFPQPVRDHLHAVVKRWMDPDGNGDPSDGIDGWRLDVADMVSLDFWKEFRTWVRDINPDGYITGEVWWEDWKNDKMFNASPWLQGDAFDAVMNYRLAREVCRFFVDEKKNITVSEFDKRLAVLRNDYRPDATSVEMNLVDSHDTDRIGSRIVNPDLLYDHNVGLHDNPDYIIRKPNAGEIQIQKLIALFQMTYPGGPMIYYGDEAGMWGGDDPDERKPMLWADVKFDDEKSHPFGKQRPADKNTFNADLFKSYKDLIRLRREHPALSTGAFTTLLADDRTNCYGFLRSTNSQYVVTVINNSSANAEIDLPLPGELQNMHWTNLWGEQEILSSGKSVRMTLSPMSGAVLEATKE